MSSLALNMVAEWVAASVRVSIPPNAVRRNPRYSAPVVSTTARSATGPLGDRNRQPSPGGEHARQAADRASLGPILVVDDDRAILATLGDILDLEGYRVITASNGAEALRRAEEVHPALVLLDMRMPVLNGWEVARILRARGSAVPILVMTAAQDARNWAEQIGAAGYLAKPFDLDDLLTAIERLMPS